MEKSLPLPYIISVSRGSGSNQTQLGSTDSDGGTPIGSLHMSGLGSVLFKPQAGEFLFLASFVFQFLSSGFKKKRSI